MIAAEEICRVAPGIFAWRAYDPAVKCDLWSTAISSSEGLILVDPIELAPRALTELTSHARIAAVVLTSGNHERAAGIFRQRHAAPIWAPRAAAPFLSLAADHEFTGGDFLQGGLQAAEIPPAGPAEVALLGSGVLCFGDAVINLDATGLSLLPAKYCAQPMELPNALRKLLSYDFHILTFAHGDPIVLHAKERLHTLLA